jgi:nucleotide-binding universal stress UspA family protein
MASEHSTSSTPPQPSPFSTDTGTIKFREIVVFVDGRSEAGNMLEFASVLAQEHGAQLIGVYMKPKPILTKAETFARGEGIREAYEAHRPELEGIESDHRGVFEDIVRRHGVRSEWRSLSHLGSEVAVQTYSADLVVIARPEPAGQTAGPLGLAESLVLSSGRPIIVFPPRGAVSRIRRVLVGWNAMRESIRAVADALPLLVRAEAVQVLVVDHGRRSAAEGREPGAEIARHLARQGARVEVRRVESDGKEVGHLLLAQAAAFGADLLVMGAYGQSHLSEWLFGSVTRTILYDAGLPVLMSR